jgi:hypothetical protein
VQPLPSPCLTSPPPVAPDPMIFSNQATRADQLAHRIEVLEAYAAQAWRDCGAKQ